jgi:F-type H+-transporting ATPase subunit alpha
MSNPLIEELKKQIAGFENEVAREEIGTVLEVGDGVARVSGLTDVLSQEMVEFVTATGETIVGVVLNLEEDEVGVMLLSETGSLKEGDVVKRTKRILSVPVADKVVGRVVNALGLPIDGKGAIEAIKHYPMEKIAPGVITRKSVNQPLQTGIKAIDALIPIGRGQRELIIGDRQTGKTAIAIDTIINQKGQGVICIYVAIGQKESKVARIVAELTRSPVLWSTPRSSWRAHRIRLLSHISLRMPVVRSANTSWIRARTCSSFMMISRNTPGRVSSDFAHPPSSTRTRSVSGRCFYVHSRLLERSAKLNRKSVGIAHRAPNHRDAGR